MRFRTILTLAIWFPACFAVAGWSELRAQPSSSTDRLATQSGSVSGRITGVAGNSFSVVVQKSQDEATLKFLIDANTKIDGKLTVGAMATVDYRAEELKNIAILSW